MEKQNLMTRVQEVMYERLTGLDAKLKEYGVHEYGKTHATEKDMERMFQNLTPQKLSQLIHDYGADKVNEWLGRYM